MYFLLTGERMTAQEALRAGLINKVVPLPELMPEADRIARKICENAPLAVRAIKELAVRGQYLPIEYGLRLEQAIQQILNATEDAKEGPRAFAEKRRPKYTGK
jgi:E-phenylitaconyl-CoA hydratase